MSLEWQQNNVDVETGLHNKFFDKLKEEPLEELYGEKKNSRSKTIDNGKKMFEDKSPRFNPSIYKFKKPDYNYS